MSGLCANKSIQWLFDFWQFYTHNTECTLNQNYLIFRKLKWQKSPVGGSLQIFINTSICKPSNWINCLALTSHEIVYSINEEKILLFEKYTFWGKNQFSEIHEYLLIFWMDFVAVSYPVRYWSTILIHPKRVYNDLFTLWDIEALSLYTLNTSLMIFLHCEILKHHENTPYTHL